MQDWRRIAHDAKDILTVCLAKGVDGAMKAQLGDGWFAEFALSDAKEKVSNRITKTGQTSVQDLDLQGLLKFLRYRTRQTEQVLQYYGFFAGMDSFAADAQIRQFHDLLDRLINDFRNRIEAHTRASDIEKELSGQSVSRIYGYQEAVRDMQKLAQVFAGVADANGVAYHEKIAALTRKKKNPLVFLLPVAAAAALLVGFFLWNSSEEPKDSNMYQGNSAPVFEEGKVSVQVIRAYYEGRELVAECYVTNGSAKTAYNIDVCSFKLTSGGETLAAARFGSLGGVVLSAGESVRWTFRFPENTVMVKDADLSALNTQIELDHE